jgi:predicted flap endonuclease-1-like 5' DNA nuclease
MGKRLPTQLERLQRERERLEELLMLDANWRALRQLDQRGTARDPQHSADVEDRRARLTTALAGNRIFAARAKLIETIELLSTFSSGGETICGRHGGNGDGAAPLSSRIVMLNPPGAESFRARVRIKKAEEVRADDVRLDQVLGQAPSSETRADARLLPDALELIDGLGRNAVGVLLAHEVRRFADIASWSPADAAVWRARLDGLAEGLPSSWMEQAALLATGHETHYAARVRRGEFASLVPSPAPEPARPEPPVLSQVVDVVGEPTSGPPTAPPPAARTSTEHPAPIDLAKVDRVPLEPAAAAANADQKLPLLSRLSLRRRGFSKQIEPISELAEVSEVVLISRTVGDSSEIGTLTPRSGPHPNRLVRRLKALEREEPFSASGYAAYRGEVEEASVTIVGPDARSTAPKVDQATPAERPAVHRFLRALTGRR